MHHHTFSPKHQTSASMSVSEDSSSPVSLYCNEASRHVVSSDTDVSLPSSNFTIEAERSILFSDVDITTIDSVTFLDFPVDDEYFIVSSLDSELDQMPEPRLINRLFELPEVIAARQEAVKWMLKVHSFYRFRPETAYLSVSYFDRFLCSHTLPNGKGWPQQLLAVACLSIAAKLEEISVPPLLDMQILQPRFQFKPSTVQRMELLVMASLKWRLRIITPFCFLHYFIAKISCLSPNRTKLGSVFSCASDLIISTCRVINFLDYTPSSIAAAAVIWAINPAAHQLKWECFHKKVNKEMVERCYDLIKRSLPELSKSKALDATIPRKCHAKTTSKSDCSSGHGSNPNKCLQFKP